GAAEPGDPGHGTWPRYSALSIARSHRFPLERHTARRPPWVSCEVDSNCSGTALRWKESSATTAVKRRDPGPTRTSSRAHGFISHSGVTDRREAPPARGR